MNDLIEMNIGKQTEMRIAFDDKDIFVIKSKICKFLKLFLFIQGKHFKQDKQKTNITALNSSLTSLIYFC